MKTRPFCGMWTHLIKSDFCVWNVHIRANPDQTVWITVHHIKLTCTIGLGRGERKEKNGLYLEPLLIRINEARVIREKVLPAKLRWRVLNKLYTFHTPAEFVRSTCNGCWTMYTFCPPVRSNFLIEGQGKVDLQNGIYLTTSMLATEARKTKWLLSERFFFCKSDKAETWVNDRFHMEN